MVRNNYRTVKTKAPLSRQKKIYTALITLFFINKSTHTAALPQDYIYAGRLYVPYITRSGLSVSTVNCLSNV